MNIMSIFWLIVRTLEVNLIFQRVYKRSDWEFFAVSYIFDEQKESDIFGGDL